MRKLQKWAQALSSKLIGSGYDKQEVPPLLQGGFYTILLGGALASLPLIGQKSPVPMTALLDVWTVLFVATCLLRGRTTMYIAFYFFIGYALTRIIPALLNDSPLEDFFQAYRWLLYAAAFILAAGRTWVNVRLFTRVVNILLLIALAKYLTTYLVFSGERRPVLFLENNFELALFAGAVAVAYRSMGKWRWLSVAAVGALTLLSGSRSGSVSFVILAIFAILQIRSARNVLKYVSYVAVPAAIAVAVVVFIQRTPHLDRIDRVKFAITLFKDTSTWSVPNFIFGTDPITPLSAESCNQLAYYTTLFSSEGNGNCYAVILHAFALRVFFDAGLLGLAIAFGIPLLSMLRSRTNWGICVTVLAIALANSLSVSGLNNPYVCAPILLAILLTQETRAEVPGPRLEPLKTRADVRRRRDRIHSGEHSAPGHGPE